MVLWGVWTLILVYIILIQRLFGEVELAVIISEISQRAKKHTVTCHVTKSERHHSHVITVKPKILKSSAPTI